MTYPRHRFRHWQHASARRHAAYGPPRFVRRVGCAFAALIVFGAVIASSVATFIVRAPNGVAVLVAAVVATIALVTAFIVTLRRVARVFGEQTRLRRQLMADVAHELRTPLAILQGRIEGLLDGVYPRDDGHIAELLTETQHLSRLVDDVRTLANAEAGALELRKEAVDAGELIRDAASAVDVAIAVDVPDELPLDADPIRIREVLLNLLTNATQHAAGAPVRVRGAANGRTIVITVHDDGPGIAPDELPRIFDRFHKGRASRGSGLGLAIAKKLVEAHGGSIDLASAPGAGTTVTVTLPRR